jgi:hypothetical protein
MATAAVALVLEDAEEFWNKEAINGLLAGVPLVECSAVKVPVGYMQSV